MLVSHPRKAYFDRARSARQSRGETAQPENVARGPGYRVTSQSIRAVLDVSWTECPAKSLSITTSNRALAYISSSDGP